MCPAKGSQRRTPTRETGGSMRRVIGLAAGALLVASLASTATASSGASTGNPGRAEHYGNKLACGAGSALCAEANDALGYRGGYTGHDEPSALFYSSTP